MRQQQALEILARRPSGITSTDLATLLDLEPRRCRTVVTSLVERGLAVVVAEGRARRVWLPALRKQWVDDRGWVRYHLDKLKPAPVCPSCGQAIPADAPRRLRAI